MNWNKLAVLASNYFRTVYRETCGMDQKTAVRFSLRCNYRELRSVRITKSPVFMGVTVFSVRFDATTANYEEISLRGF
jgi:hypothetical protein